MKKQENNIEKKQKKKKNEIEESNQIDNIEKIDEIIEEQEKEEPKERKKPRIHIPFLTIAFLSFITYLVIEILNYKDKSLLNFLPQLLGLSLILCFLICFTIISYRTEEKKTISIIIGSLIIIIYSAFNILLTLGYLKFPSDEYIPNFHNQPITEVIFWKEKNNINITEKYEYSDTILKNYIISQDKSYPVLTKDIDELTITISLGPDLDKEIIVPSFIGLSFDEVIKFIEENHLSNIEINYQKDDDHIDKVISQDGIGTLKRNAKIIFTIGIPSEEQETIDVIDLSNKSEIYATSWLKKYQFKYETSYEFNDKIKKDYVISQNLIGEQNPNEVTIKLVISKGKQTVVPDLQSMSVDEINTWILENDLKVSYVEEYSDSIKLGDVISSSIGENETVSSGENITIKISKGSLKMPKLTSVNTFINWAESNNIKYDLVYENSDTIKKDEIIKCSHNEGQLIKSDDTIIITISRGKSITIPNFVGMKKSDIQNKCTSVNLNCSFKYGSYTEKTNKDIATGQSRASGRTVSEGTSLVITLSPGIIQKVSVPNMVGKTKSQAEAQCKNVGITCKFTYKSGYNEKAKNTVLSQSTTGTVNKGSTVTFTLSNGPAKTFTVIIDKNELSNGNAAATKATLEKELKNSCPGVTFKFSYQKANNGIGYLAQNSEVKVGANKLTQGKTYKVIINSN